MLRLAVSVNRRFLVHEDGTPFFYLGDTAWELFHRLNREEAEHYLRTRAEQGFTVIQAVALAEHEYDRPNPYDFLPLEDNDPTRPVAGYFEHVDWVVRRANELGLRVGMLPTWGDKWNRKWGVGPEIFTVENARAYGEWIGRRYRGAGIVWIMGGDRPVETMEQADVQRAMAEGVRAGDGGAHLMTWHPMGMQSSSHYFHLDRWLDFNMCQTGHTLNRESWRMVGSDYTRTPTKPCMDGEPGYEDHPDGFHPEYGYLTDYDVRKAAYWDLFAGGFGHTYGCHAVWQFHGPDWEPVNSPRTPWREALQLPGAWQMRHVKRLMLSRPFLNRVPDQAIILSDPGEAGARQQATRAEDGSYAFVYLPDGRPVTVDMARFQRENMRAWWFDPRTGDASEAASVACSHPHEFAPPDGQDWILALDDPAREFPPP